jgi:glycosyltransferase involved in cell wall biosynthesis
MQTTIMTPIGYTGYGYVGLNILKGFYIDQNLDNIGLYPIGNPSIEDEDDASIVKKYMSNLDSIEYNATCLKIWHQFDLMSRIGKGKYMAMPFFETDSLSNKDKINLNFPDQIIVSSSWAKQVLIDNDIKTKIDIVKLGVDRSIFDNALNAHQAIPRDKYIFITIGKWEKRKAHDTIIDCFNKAFNTNDNVELWMLTHNGFLTPEEENVWITKVMECKLKDKIKIFPRVPSQKDVAKIISYTDCGVYISRGEGWNMELLETMAMDKPVIASNYSAHTEYCNENNSYLVQIEDKETAIDNKWFFGNGNWAKLGQSQIDQTIGYMQHVYKNNIRTNSNGLETAKKLSWSSTIGCLKDHI